MDTKRFTLRPAQWSDLEAVVDLVRDVLTADGDATSAVTPDELEREWKSRDVRFAKSLPLPRLAAILERAVFIGHDSGISHLAAAAGARCILLFGPTDPNVWAPKNDNVQILRAPNAKLSDLGIEQVEKALAAAETAANHSAEDSGRHSVSPNSRVETSGAISKRFR